MDGVGELWVLPHANSNDVMEDTAVAVCAADFVIFSPNDTMCSCPTPCYDCFVEHVLYLSFFSFFSGGGGGGGG